MKYVLLAILGFGLDYIWALYTAAVAAKKPLPSAVWSVGIYLAGGISVISYTEDHWTLVPLIIGSFFGTYTAVRREANGSHSS